MLKRKLGQERPRHDLSSAILQGVNWHGSDGPVFISTCVGIIAGGRAMSREHLEIPERISPNGQELWEWAGRFSEHIHRVDRQRRLQQQLRELQRECGSCRLWMTRECSREAPNGLTGYSKGPSMSAPICSQFVMSAASVASQRVWESELVTIEQQIRDKAAP